MLDVKIVYKPLDKKEVSLQINIKAGGTVLDALNHSGIYHDFPEADGLQVGIFSKRVTLDRLVQAGDRIEIYRPLLISPKERRRQKALLSK